MALKSLGKVVVTTAGTLVRLTMNETAPAARYGCQALYIRGLAGNTGDVYIGTSVMVRSTLVGVYAIVPKGTSLTIDCSNAPAGFNAAELYLDADTNSDSALVSVVQQ
jgi:hypothetical protein